LADIAFQVYNNHNLEEERREENKERRQAKLMAAATGDTPVPKTSSDKKGWKAILLHIQEAGKELPRATPGTLT
jgi:hypothetical protein